MKKGFYYNTNEITRGFINSILNPAAVNEIIVTFKNGLDATYTMDIFELLKTDPDTITIIDALTGELLFCR